MEGTAENVSEVMYGGRVLSVVRDETNNLLNARAIC